MSRRSWVLLALLVCAALPVRALPRTSRFLFSWGPVPVGRVTLRWEPDGGVFTYRSEHFFAKAAPVQATRFEKSFVPDGGGRPEALWLWEKPAQGCVDGFDERTGVTGRLCAEPASEDVVRGRALGERFEAHYRDRTLTSLRMGTARFDELAQASSPLSPVDVFSPGLAVRGSQGPLRLGGGARAGPGAVQTCGALRPWSEVRARQLAASLREEHPSDVASCVERAKRFVARARRLGGGARVIRGLVREGSVAYPHAWVRVATGASTLDLDPTLEGPVEPTHYLVLDACDDPAGFAEVGALYRDLYAETRFVERAGPGMPSSGPGR